MVSVVTLVFTISLPVWVRLVQKDDFLGKMTTFLFSVLSLPVDELFVFKCGFTVLFSVYFVVRFFFSLLNLLSFSAHEHNWIIEKKYFPSVFFPFLFQHWTISCLQKNYWGTVYLFLFCFRFPGCSFLYWISTRWMTNVWPQLCYFISFGRYFWKKI